MKMKNTLDGINGRLDVDNKRELKDKAIETFIGRTEVEVETPILWPPDVKNWLTGTHPDAGKD